ncbi:DnaJ domain-containing protein [Marinobacter sp. CHS3-4]|uniref:DnaJ domain-containing protein n=1 Tax=Marinobacter sp. CHS3-4 TaxID=3045174 RepID=UPI0024B4C198|nr:DnaJ domain-containing protein [Marinobacter sp. CHS3-4]MDI9244183.1 DnaJ domain-containing protein [Marinobacter sp. CHS3-4]
MSDSAPDTALPGRMEAEFASLLGELSACGHQASELMVRTRLPGWCRRSLFYFLGYIAKSEGRVTEKDIGFAETLMKALHLSKRQRRVAIKHFQNGKNAETIPVAKALRLKLSHRIWPSPSLRVAICLCHAAQLFGRPAKKRRYRCEDAIDQMGLPISISDDILDSYASKIWITQPESHPKPTTYEQALQILGVTRRDSLTDMKRAYRKRVSECHPDKLAQRNLSPTELTRAKDTLLKIQQAWELIERRHSL